MILRIFLYIIEEFHLLLAKELAGSTISIGGEEKKAKIISNMTNTTLDTQPATSVMQETEDATKWNECLAPSCFAVMHRFLFDESLRVTLGLPKPSENAKLFSRIAVTGNFFMALKEIQLGTGVIIESKSFFRKCNGNEKKTLKKNSTREQFNGITR